MAVQAVVKLRDVPIATTLSLFFMILGGTVFITVCQTVQLGKLLPRLQGLNPSLTISDIIKAGATGVRNLVAIDQLPLLLKAYAESVDAAFIVTIATAGA